MPKPFLLWTLLTDMFTNSPQYPHRYNGCSAADARLEESARQEASKVWLDAGFCHRRIVSTLRQFTKPGLTSSSVCMVSVLRLYFLHKTQGSTNFTYESVQPVTWSSMEANIGIITSSLPTLRPLVLRMFPSLASSSTNSKTHSRRYHGSRHGSSFGVWKPFGLNDRTNKSRRDDTEGWTIGMAGSTGHTVVHQLDVEGQHEHAVTLPGQIRVATTIKHDYESAHSSDDAIRAADEVELIKTA